LGDSDSGPSQHPHVRLGSPSEPDLAPDLNGIPLQTHIFSEWGSVSGLCVCECDAILETRRQCMPTTHPSISQSHVLNAEEYYYLAGSMAFSSSSKVGAARGEQ
jgi:hypothetical protein